MSLSTMSIIRIPNTLSKVFFAFFKDFLAIFRERSVGPKSEFQRILEEKMAVSEGEFASSTAAEPGFSEGNTQFPLYESLIASLLEAGVNFNFYPTASQKRTITATFYPRKSSPRKTVRPRPNEKTVLVKDLKPEANQALCRLISLGTEELKDAELLSESMVKRTFRRLALRIHPDQNPQATGSEFRSAREAYVQLLAAIKAA